ncbi:hypothetical protein DPEC_G00370300 [Dallia pectoralis]|nr:hypothetical protein DPEC_G00370300 [Dallia pectoralis]
MVGTSSGPCPAWPDTSRLVRGHLHPSSVISIPLPHFTARLGEQKVGPCHGSYMRIRDAVLDSPRLMAIEPRLFEISQENTVTMVLHASEREIGGRAILNQGLVSAPG